MRYIVYYTPFPLSPFLLPLAAFPFPLSPFLLSPPELQAEKEQARLRRALYRVDVERGIPTLGTRCLALGAPITN